MGEKDKSGSASASAEIGKYLDILAKDPNSRVFAPLAEAYRKAGLLDDAIETALEGLNVHPNYLGGRVALGRAYFEKRQYAEAAAEMQKVVKAAPDNLMAHKVLGQIAYGQNDLAAAEKAFKMVLLLDPRDQEAQQLIANISGGGARPAPPPRRAPEPSLAAAAPPPLPPTPEPASIEELRTSAPSPPQGVAAGPAAIPEDLTIEDISLDAPLPGLGGLELPLPSAAAGEPARQPAGERGEIEFPEIDFVGEETEPPPPEDRETQGEAEPAAAAVPAALQPIATPAAPAPPAMELEIFAREPWGMERPGEPAPPAVPSPSPAAPETAPGASPIEVFGRSKKGGPPESTKGEQEAYAEIEFEPTAHAPVEAAPDEGGSPFEVFTREPRGGGAPTSTPRAGRDERAGYGDIEIETTGYSPTVPGEGDFSPAGMMSLGEEPPGVDQAREVDPDLAEEPPAFERDSPPVPDIDPWAPAPVVPEAETAGIETAERVSDAGSPAGATEPGPGDAGAAPDPAAHSEELSVIGQPEEEITLEDELPQIDLTREVEPEFDDAEPPAESPAGEVPPSRGVFDTETLAAIYIDQGFYARAAEIYQRLLAQRPGDPALLQKLEEVRALEGMEQGKGAPVAGPVESPAAAGGGADERVRLLQTLLEAFRGGEPQ